MIDIFLWIGALLILTILAGYCIGLIWGAFCIVWYFIYWLWRALCDTI